MSELERKNRHHHKPTNIEREKGGYMSGILSKALLLIFILAGLTACSPAVYHVNLKYEPAGQILKPEKTGPDIAITVAMFNDIRKVDDRLLLGRVTTLQGDRIPISCVKCWTRSSRPERRRSISRTPSATRLRTSTRR